MWCIRSHCRCEFILHRIRGPVADYGRSAHLYGACIRITRPMSARQSRTSANYSEVGRRKRLEVMKSIDTVTTAPGYVVPPRLSMWGISSPLSEITLVMTAHVVVAHLPDLPHQHSTSSHSPSVHSQPDITPLYPPDLHISAGTLIKTRTMIVYQVKPHPSQV